MDLRKLIEEEVRKQLGMIEESTKISDLVRLDGFSIESDMGTAVLDFLEDNAKNKIIDLYRIVFDLIMVSNEEDIKGLLDYKKNVKHSSTILIEELIERYEQELTPIFKKILSNPFFDFESSYNFISRISIITFYVLLNDMKMNPRSYKRWLSREQQEFADDISIARGKEKLGVMLSNARIK